MQRRSIYTIQGQQQHIALIAEIEKSFRHDLDVAVSRVNRKGAGLGYAIEARGDDPSRKKIVFRMASCPGTTVEFTFDGDVIWWDGIMYGGRQDLLAIVPKIAREIAVTHANSRLAGPKL